MVTAVVCLALDKPARCSRTCQGVSGLSCLKPPFRKQVFIPHYRLEFVEGHGLCSQPDPYTFRADTEEEALVKAARALDVGKLTARAFRQAGGKRLMFMGVQVFPPLSSAVEEERPKRKRK